MEIIPSFAQSTNNVPQTNSNDPLSWLQAFLAAGAIGVSFFLYWRQQRNERNGILKRSQQTILRELKENEEAITKRYTHESYTITRVDKITKIVSKIEINYTNAYLDSDAYASILNTGSFTHLPLETQHKLSMLYGRIRAHNELITYVDRFQDSFLLYDKSPARIEKWYKAVERYDITLTHWEKEILDHFEEVKKLLEDKK